ncbi:hypothetical protein ACJIZ3_001127 [Penstemon smallii]|uniref:BZIP domain-containing protein n=1 Tax=Penstemon smallii TaxID=265156 RepID=A0ABD3U2S7_9LAMI
MASSKVMASRSPPNPDLPLQPSPPPLNLHSDRSKGLDSMNMEEILRNIYSDSDPFPQEINGGGPSSAEAGGVNKTVEEVWRDIVTGGIAAPSMTLEDFLAKAGAVAEEDVRVPHSVAMGQPAPMMSPAAGVPAVQFGQFGVDYGNGVVALSTGDSGRGKRRASVEEVPLDRATQQKQRRMIKNRESAARSRERKQAYTVELESLVTQLEEDNARLLKEELKENLIPVVEKRRPPRVLRKVHSAEW